jgi:hypothetical protein
MVTTASHPTNRRCGYHVSSEVPAGRRCGLPAVGRWQEQDEEWFCAAHLGDDLAAADLSICPQCFSPTDYDPAYPGCRSCGYLLPVLTNSD